MVVQVLAADLINWPKHYENISFAFFVSMPYQPSWVIQFQSHPWEKNSSCTVHTLHHGSYSKNKHNSVYRVRIHLLQYRNQLCLPQHKYSRRGVGNLSHLLECLMLAFQCLEQRYWSQTHKRRYTLRKCTIIHMHEQNLDWTWVFLAICCIIKFSLYNNLMKINIYSQNLTVKLKQIWL